MHFGFSTVLLVPLTQLFEPRADCVTRMTGFADVLSVVHLVVAIGWLPLLRVSQCNPSVRRAVHQQGQALILVQLAECGLTLGPTTPLPVGQLAHLLYTLLLSPLLRHDDQRLRNSRWWGPIVPAVECRVGIRHKRQNPPRRRWRRARGRVVARENLPGLFPDNCFDLALAALAVHGNNFRLCRNIERDVSDVGGHLLGVRLEVLTLLKASKCISVGAMLAISIQKGALRRPLRRATPKIARPRKPRYRPRGPEKLYLDRKGRFD